MDIFMRFSPIGRGVQAHFFICLMCRKIISHVHKNSKWRPTDRMLLGLYGTNEISANFQWKSPFLRSRNTVELVWTLSHVCVSGKSEMAACNRKWHTEYRKSQLVYMIATKFQRLCLVYDVGQQDWTIPNIVLCQGEWYIEGCVLLPEVDMYIPLTLPQDSLRTI